MIECQSLVRAFQQEQTPYDGRQIHAVISNDESLLLTSSPGDITTPTRLWDVESGRIIREFDGHGGMFNPETTELYVFEKQGIRVVPLNATSDPVELDKELAEFEMRSATEITDTGEFRVLSYEDLLRRKHD